MKEIRFREMAVSNGLVACRFFSRNTICKVLNNYFFSIKVLCIRILEELWLNLRTTKSADLILQTILRLVWNVSDFFFFFFFFFFFPFSSP